MKKLSPSQEDYLEAILELENTNRVARVKEIAQYLDVRMPSVSGALKQLKSKGLIDYEKNSFITLTAEGKTQASRVFEKHNQLDCFFREILLLDEKTAASEACSAEHSISKKTVDRLSGLSNYLKSDILPSIDKENWQKILDSGRKSGK